MSGSAGGEDALLSELCTICHINQPKYRCPRCSIRTCSLPCTRRHKLWSQCSGVRDPAAYLKRNELANPSAFDRDFNFITGIERTLERAERDVEHRGITLPSEGELALDGDEDGGVGAGKKRKRETLVKGEAGFLRGAEASGVMVVRAPRGMSRNKENMSRWHPKHKCLSWTVEWIASDGQKIRRNCSETCTIAEAYDRIWPPPKEEKQVHDAHAADFTPHTVVDAGIQAQQAHEDGPGKPLEQPKDGEASQDIDKDDTQDTLLPETEPPQTTAAEISQPESDTQNQPRSLSAPVTYRGFYFYLHRPRTATKQTVLIPLQPSDTLTTSLRNRMVLEFPTLYVLLQSPQELSQSQKDKEEEVADCQFLLEEDYLRIYGQPPEEGSKSSEESEEEGAVNDSAMTGLPDVDEKKVLEVLQQDLSQT
ncbi:HIT finger domain protein [Paecilomyces variotii No. 5]|uniref:Box C/D snoRNA protein 1 n=1 Tax=Byssochlamys spectabilis (strain No. 5 / NBRC 109023) TaxID=1356009 RepID=V5FA13_BYSSN|nr:HIT finger domain protein [Paecilomyces variotii No. 5]